MSRQASLRLKKSNAVWLGVCSGIADWLDIPAAVVRTIFVVSVLFWPTLFFGYFVMWFCMDRDIFRDRTWDNLDPAGASEHFRNLNYRKPIYRNTRDKKLAGVCAGIADYLEVSPFWIRLLTVLSLFMLGPFTFLGYIVSIFLLDPDPFLEEERLERRRNRRRRRRGRGSRAERRAAAVDDGPPGDSGRDSGRSAGPDVGHNSGNGSNGKRGEKGNCAATFRDLEKRLREIESYMTSKSFRLHCEIKRA